MLECGANVNVVVNGGHTQLSIAVETENLDLVEFLVANGADINQEVPWIRKGTVLHRACEVRNANFFSIGLDWIGLDWIGLALI